MASWSGGGAGGKDGGVDGEQYVVSDGVEYTNIPLIILPQHKELFQQKSDINRNGTEKGNVGV